jgi:hypothetical protein
MIHHLDPTACANALVDPQASGGALRWLRSPADSGAARREPLFCDGLLDQRDRLFGWTMARSASLACRRAFAEQAVAVQRRQGPAEFLVWLYRAALAAAQQAGSSAGLPESALTGFTPELRAALRLVARGDLPPEQAAALLPQSLAAVRSQLLRTRFRD